MLFRKIVFLFVCFFSILLNAQYVITEHYSEKSNLESNAVIEMFMDSRQILWVTTKYGVYIKNMDEFKSVKLFEKAHFNNVNSIFEDSNHHLWFGSNGKGLAFFDGKELKYFSKKNGLNSDFVKKITQFKGNIFVGGLNGVTKIDLVSKKKTQLLASNFDHQKVEIINFFQTNDRFFAVSKNKGIFEFKNNKFQLVNSTNPIHFAYLYKDYLVISRKQGVSFNKLEEFLAGKSTEYLYKLPVFWDYTKIDNNKYWIASHDVLSSKGDIYEYNGDTIKSITEHLNIKTIIPNRIIYDEKNRVVFVSDLNNGIIRFVLDSPYKHFSVDNAFVECIESNKGVDYIISSNGLYKNAGDLTELMISRDKFWKIYLNQKNKYSQRIVNQPYFFGVNQFLKFNDIKFQQMVIDKDFIWISSNLGLYKISLKGEIVQYHPMQVQYFTLYKDKLIETYPYGGIKIYQDLEAGKFTYHSKELKINPSSITSISSNKDAVFFACSYEGVFKYQDGKFTSYVLNGAFKEKNIQLIKTLSNNRLLVATEFGDVYIFSVQGENLKLLRRIKKEKLESSTINFVEEVNQKIIIGSFSNLLVIDNDKLFFVDNKQSLSYKMLTASSSNNQNLLVGTENGYYVINVNSLAKSRFVQPKINIWNVQINGKKLNQDKYNWFDLVDRNIHLSHNDNNTISLDFNVVNPKYPTKYKYRYRLNKNKEWSEYIDFEKIILNNLKTGNYNLQLEVTSLVGGKKVIVDLLTIEVDPPFYFHPFFLVCAAILVPILIYRYNNIKIKAINEKNMLKIQRLKELNDENNRRITLEKKISEVKLMALQSQMNPHFIFNVLNSIQYYIIDNDVNNALESLNKFARLIRKMLDLSSKSHITIAHEINFLNLYVNIENLRHKNKVAFEVEVYPEIDINLQHIPPMLLQPLIENCFVHAFDYSKTTNRIELSLKEDQDFLLICVRDNGGSNVDSGLDENFHESKGLKIIKERLQLFNGDDEDYLTFVSEKNYTKVELKVKKLIY